MGAMPLFRICPTCEGTGTHANTRLIPCVACSGSAYVRFGRAKAPEDHPALDLIAAAMVATARYRFDDVRRESEGVTFADPATGGRFEVVVREIDHDEEGEE